MLRYFGWVLTLALSASLGVACGTKANPNADTVIPATTKVLDDSSRQALSSFSTTDGTLRFGQATSFVKALKAGDVVVSDVTTAAPGGLLRKVTSVTPDATGVTVATTDAALTDAISKGSLAALHPLVAGDVAEVTPALTGVTVGTNGAQGGGGAGGSAGIQINLDHVAISYDHENNGVTESLHLTLTGAVVIDPEIDLAINISLDGGPHVDLFRAAVSLHDSVDLTVDGQVSAGLQKEVSVVDLRFTPITFAIGYIPVVIVPHLEIKVGISGTASAQLTFHVTHNETMRLGAEFRQPGGWQDISENSHDGSFDAPTPPHLTVEGKAYAGAEFALRLYDVAGPYISAELGIDLTITIPHDPFWLLKLYLQANAGFKIKIVDWTIADWSAQLLDLEFELARSPNTSPLITIQSPTAGSYPPNPTLQLSSAPFDFEDGTSLHVTWSSDRDGFLGDGASLSRQLSTPQPGARTLTATVTDSGGLTASATVQITITDVAPAPVIDSPSAGQPTYRGQTVSLGGHVGDGFVMGDACSGSGWTFAWTSTAIGDPTAAGCSGTIAFATTGARTLTLTASDPWGASGMATVDLNVVDPPPTYLPVQVNLAVAAGSPYSGNDGSLTTPITLGASVTDPVSGAVLTYDWKATSYRANGTVYSGPTAIGHSASLAWQPNSTSGLLDIATAESVQGQKIRIDLSVADDHGNSGHDSVIIYFVWVPG